MINLAHSFPHTQWYTQLIASSGFGHTSLSTCITLPVTNLHNNMPHETLTPHFCPIIQARFEILSDMYSYAYMHCLHLKKTSCLYWSAMPSIILWCQGQGVAFKTTYHQCHYLLYICWHAEASANMVNHLFDTEELRVDAEKWDGREGSVLCYKSEQWCMTRTQSTNSCSQALFSPDLSHFSSAILTTPNLWLSEHTGEIYAAGWWENLTVQISGVTAPWVARTLKN